MIRSLQEKTKLRIHRLGLGTAHFEERRVESRDIALEHMFNSPLAVVSPNNPTGWSMSANIVGIVDVLQHSPRLK